MSLPSLLPERPVSGKALASVGLALLCWVVVFFNTRPTTDGGVQLTFLLGAVGLLLAVWSLKDIWQGHVQAGSFLLLFPGAGGALFAMVFAYGIRATDVADSRGLQMMHKLKQVALALHDYEKAHGRLPPAAVYAKDGTPLLSWRVLVLPFLEEDFLYKEFRLDEAWDSPRNRPLLKRMPRVFGPPEGITAAPSHTFLQVFVGPGTAFEDKDGVRLGDFPDGLDKTMLVAEAGDAVPWTKPDDMRYAPDQPLPNLGAVFPKSFRAAFADGGVRRIPKDTPEAVLRALITRNGGETVEPK